MWERRTRERKIKQQQQRCKRARAREKPCLRQTCFPRAPRSHARTLHTLALSLQTHTLRNGLGRRRGPQAAAGGGEKLREKEREKRPAIASGLRCRRRRGSMSHARTHHAVTSSAPPAQGAPSHAPAGPRAAGSRRLSTHTAHTNTLSSHRMPPLPAAPIPTTARTSTTASART